MLLSPIATVFGGLFVRSNRVHEFAIVTMLAEVAGLAVSIAGLLSGWGVLALAAGKIALQVVLTALVYWRADWSYRIRLKSGQTWHVLATSGQILANRFISYMQSNGATFIVGAFLGPAGVGFFRAAERVVSSVAELVMEPLRMIAWMQFRSAAVKAAAPDEIPLKLADKARQCLPLFIIAAAPVFVGLAAVSQDIVNAILGPTWAPAGPVAALLALTALTQVPKATAEPLLSLAGEMRRLPMIMLVNALVTIALMTAFGSFGLIALALASLAAGMVGLGTTVWLLQRSIGIKWGEACLNALPALVALAAMTGTVFAVQWLSELKAFPLFLGLSMQVFLGACAYFLTLLAIRPQMLMSVLKM